MQKGYLKSEDTHVVLYLNGYLYIKLWKYFIQLLFLLLHVIFKQSERSFSKGRNNSRGKSCDDSDSFWVGHCIVKRAQVQELEDSNSSEVTMDLHQSSSNFPEELETKDHQHVLTLIHRSLIHRWKSLFLASNNCSGSGGWGGCRSESVIQSNLYITANLRTWGTGSLIQVAA